MDEQLATLNSMGGNTARYVEDASNSDVSIERVENGFVVIHRTGYRSKRYIATTVSELPDLIKKIYG